MRKGVLWGCFYSHVSRVLGWLQEVGGPEVVESVMNVGLDRYSFLIIARKCLNTK